MVTYIAGDERGVYFGRNGGTYERGGVVRSAVYLVWRAERSSCAVVYTIVVFLFAFRVFQLIVVHFCCTASVAPSTIGVADARGYAISFFFFLWCLLRCWVNPSLCVHRLETWYQLRGIARQREYDIYLPCTTAFTLFKIEENHPSFV